jgi:SAM-dependent methyltransferase
VHSGILTTVARYYSDRLREFGATARGVDWRSEESQALRFRYLLHLLDDAETGDPVTLNDYGCGYGGLVDHLADCPRAVRYRGFDISEPMIEAARLRYADVPWCGFVADAAALQPAEYTVASGIFNVKLDHPVEEWRNYVLETIDTLHALSTRGFAFNVLSTSSDPEKRRPDLFYADPLEMFAHCQQRFSRRVALLHDAPLYEFTIIVRM